MVIAFRRSAATEAGRLPANQGELGLVERFELLAEFDSDRS